jgi:hypothetical protein
MRSARHGLEYAGRIGARGKIQRLQSASGGHASSNPLITFRRNMEALALDLP